MTQSEQKMNTHHCIRNIYKTLCLLLVAMTMLVLVSCKEQTRKYVIAVSQCSTDVWREKLNDELRTAQYLNDSIEVRLASADDSSEKQVRQINGFIDEGVDILVVSPNNLNAISPAVNRAYDKGIPVILYDRKTNSDKYTAYMGCNNYLIGKTMATFIAQRLKGKGRVVEIRGLEGSSPAIERHRGFVESMKKYPGVQIVASDSGDWKEESAVRAMKRILAKTQDFDYVYAHNDRMAWGAYKAAQQLNVKRKYHYTGVDAMATEGGGLELVRDGVLDATYLYPTRGNELVELALKILRKEQYDRENQLPATIITHDNAEITLMEARDAEQQKRNLDTLHRQVDHYLADYNTQKMLLIAVGAFLMMFVVATVLMYRGYVVKARLNEQLARKNDELKRLNEEVIELTNSRLTFFTNISHELRTPLTLIADPVEMLLADNNIKGKAHDLLRMVQRNALALQQLVGSILDFRKIQNGKMSLTLNRFNIVEALSVWTDDFRLTAERKNIGLHLDVSRFNEPHNVVADREKVSRIVFNLLSNALKYTPAGGDIFVALRDEEGGKMRIDVRDTGKGIAAEEVNKVFERFFQTKGTAGGTGIGLALVKSFAELHHGEATVESSPGEGADFIVVLPRQQEGEVVAVQAESDNADTEQNAQQYIDDNDRKKGGIQRLVDEQTEKPTLLIIDDNSDIRQYERTLLQTDYIVLEAADGKEGWEIAQREVPDLVICDVMMPVMDGLEFTEKLKTTTATSHIPVIMLTAKTQEEHRAEGYEHGADSYIAKPFHSKVLLSRIDNLLRQRRMLKNVFQGKKEVEQTVAESQLEDRDKQFMRQLHDIIHAHLSDSDFSVEDIGKSIGLSRVQLYRKVKAMTGTTVVDLLRKARLAKAHRLLESRGMSVSEVAYTVGFSSPSYFTKCFKDEYGVLPGDIMEGK